MPNLKSSKKRMRQSIKRRLNNKSYRTAIKNQIKKFFTSLKEHDADVSKDILIETISLLDKVGQKRIFHGNKVNRLKAKMQKKYNQILD